jgi:hypothetical protein
VPEDLTKINPAMPEGGAPALIPFPERFFVSQLQRPDEAFSAMAPFRVQLPIGLFP